MSVNWAFKNHPESLAGIGMNTPKPSMTWDGVLFFLVVIHISAVLNITGETKSLDILSVLKKFIS